MHASVSKLSLLFCWSMCLFFLCQNNSFFDDSSSVVSSEVKEYDTSISVLSQDCFGYSRSFGFPNFTMISSGFVKNAFGILIGIVLNQYTILGSMLIKTWILLIQEVVYFSICLCCLQFLIVVWVQISPSSI